MQDGLKGFVLAEIGTPSVNYERITSALTPRGTSCAEGESDVIIR